MRRPADKLTTSLALFSRGLWIRTSGLAHSVSKLLLVGGTACCLMQTVQAQPWVARNGLTSPQYQQEFNKWVALGYRLTDVSGYQVGGVARYAAIWEQKFGPAWIAQHGLASAQYQETFTNLVNRGYRLTHVSGYGLNGQDFYAAIWELGSGPAWVARHGLTSSAYQQEFDKWAALGYRLTDVSGYEVGGIARYAAIWRRSLVPLG